MGDISTFISLRNPLRELSACPLLHLLHLHSSERNVVHFAQSLRYQPFGNDTDFDFHEIIVGPLNAGPFNRPNLDETFAPERLFYYAPAGRGGNLDCRCRIRVFGVDKSSSSEYRWWLLLSHRTIEMLGNTIMLSLFWHSESTADTEGNYTYAENIRPFFNFGLADIDVSGNLNFSIINTDNEVCVGDKS